MAIKIECAQCGFRNDLGRVFCTQCGQKLDMSRTAMTDMKVRREFEAGKTIGKVVGWLVPLGIVAILGLVVWPASHPAVLMDQAGLQQVPIKMRAVKTALSAHHPVSFELGEGEVNGYLAARAQSRKLVALTADFKPGSFDLHARMNWVPPVTNLTWLAHAKIPITCGLTCAFDKGTLVVRGARVGHLPLIGPLKAPVMSFFAKAFNDVMAEGELVKALRQVTFGDARADLSFGQ